jgi:putative endonuclease
MEYVYVLLSEADGQLYTGLSSDLKRRLAEHNAGEVASTKHRIPLRLIYYEACLCRVDAAAREKYLKTGMGKRYLRNRLKRFLGGLAP